MNSTTATIPPGDRVAWFIVGCAAILLFLVVALFGRVQKDTWCFTCGKFLKIKCLQICCCHKKVEENAEELRDLVY